LAATGFFAGALVRGAAFFAASALGALALALVASFFGVEALASDGLAFDPWAAVVFLRAIGRAPEG
jgi:hypothetical protein